MLLLVLIALLAFGAVRAIVGPVARLQGFARELGAGRFGARLPETGPPETAELAHAFNVSAESLQRATERHLAELDAVFRDSPLGLAFLDLDLRFLRVNEALARMNQVPAAEHLGRTVGEVTGLHDVERALRRVVETGEPLLDLDVALHGRRFEASYFPVRDDRGELLAVGKAMTDVTARRRAEAARERLQDATAALARAVTVADVARVAIEQARLALDAEQAVAADASTPSASGCEIVDDHGLSPEARGALGHGSRSPSRCRPRDAARTAESVFVSDEATLLERSRRWPARRTRARAPTRRCRWSPTAARSACSRSPSRAASPSTRTSARCCTRSPRRPRSRSPARSSTSASTRSPRRCRPRCCRARCPACPGSTSPAGSRRAPGASRSAATSTTRSRSATARGASRSATSAARASTRPR